MQSEEIIHLRNWISTLNLVPNQKDTIMSRFIWAHTYSTDMISGIIRSCGERTGTTRFFKMITFVFQSEVHTDSSFDSCTDGWGSEMCNQAQTSSRKHYCLSGILSKITLFPLRRPWHLKKKKRCTRLSTVPHHTLLYFHFSSRVSRPRVRFLTLKTRSGQDSVVPFRLEYWTSSEMNTLTPSRIKQTTTYLHVHHQSCYLGHVDKDNHTSRTRIQHLIKHFFSNTQISKV